MTSDGQTTEELLQEIESLKRLNKELLDTFHETERLEFSWSGNLGQWFWDFRRNEVIFNPMKAGALGYTEEELPERVPFEFFTDKVHPDDYDRVMDHMRAHLYGELPVWEVKYRIKAKDGSWKVYQDRGKVTERSEEGKPLFLKGIVFDVTEEERERELLKENNLTLKSKMKIDSLTSLYTRSVMLFELGKSVNKAKNFEQALSVILLRVDNQTTYEAEFGTIVSEEILKEIGHVIKKVVGEQYLAGRSRETVFMVILNDKSAKEAFEVAEAIRKEVADTFFTIPRKVTISAAVSTFEPNQTISELTEGTREKLMNAQRQGGNVTVL
ncbi:sensor domain-containing diguanylate cyclase [Jeotgalibaca caeni]|uniref:sensor domain-containing diguanylate cyclase n=1 Tax=Jeotgalibaca caeni TaxID=3028623 RepID=UPI00237E4817|nr:sensor domain-containing diguanylate cyclase [Jeotgalibaca caeni]MDE1547802.1 sensor domain-containing diguanylate cyclase [Jeotgalibaca caeni]